MRKFIVFFYGFIILSFVGIGYLWYRQYLADEARYNASQKIYHLRRIVIDPGHGGKDSGTLGNGKLKEKDVNLDMALRLEKILTEKGFKVFLTRRSDVFISLDERARFANIRKADLYISLHCNASLKKHVRGFEVYYLRKDLSDGLTAQTRAISPYGLRQFLMVHSEPQGFFQRFLLWEIIIQQSRFHAWVAGKMLLRQIQKELYIFKGSLKTAGFRVLKKTFCPALLVEMGYLSNDEDQKLLASPIYRHKICTALANSVMQFKRGYETI